MKFQLIFIVLFFNSIDAKKGGGGGDENQGKRGKGGERKGFPMPGCDIIQYPNNVTASSCCPNLPENFTNWSVFENCKSNCSSDSDAICCYSKCIFSNVLNSNGNIDVDKYTSSLLQSNPNPDGWTATTKNVINSCLSFLQNISTTSTCPSSINVGLEMCVRRSLFLQCPVPVSSTDCQTLFKYANACLAFPFLFPPRGGGHKHGNGENKWGKSKGGRQKEKNNGSNGNAESSSNYNSENNNDNNDQSNSNMGGGMRGK